MLARKPKGAVEKRGSGVSSLLWMLVGAILTVMVGVSMYLWNPFDLGTETKVEERTVEPIDQPAPQTDDYEFYDLLPEQEITSIPDEAIVRDDELYGEDYELEPDVVVTDENSARNNRTNNSDAGNYGISEDTISNPMGSDNQNVADDEIEMVIVEEEGTYDEPSTNNNSNNNQNNSGQNTGASQNNGRANTVNNSANATTARANAPKLSYILQINSFSNAQEADKRRAQVLMAGVDAHVVKNKMANGQVFYQVVSSTMTNRQGVISAQQKLQNNGIDSLIVEQRR